MNLVEGSVAVIGHLAWPVTMLLLWLVARREFARLLSVVTSRIADRNADVVISRDGLHIKAKIEAQEAQVTALLMEQEQLKALALEQLSSHDLRAPKRAAPEADAPIDDFLRREADAYMAIAVSNYSERVAVKNAMAERMGLYVVASRINRDALARETHEGLILALAAAVLFDPAAADAARLLRAGKSATRLHVRYRLLVALTRLITKRMLPESSHAELLQLIDAFKRDADRPLLELITNVNSLLQEASSGYAISRSQ